MDAENVQLRDRRERLRELRTSMHRYNLASSIIGGFGAGALFLYVLTANNQEPSAPIIQNFGIIGLWATGLLYLGTRYVVHNLQNEYYKLIDDSS